MKKKIPLEDKDLIDLFLDSGLTEKNSAKLTLKAYKTDLIDFVFFLNKLSKSLINFQNNDFAKYVDYLAGKKFKVASRSRKISVISQLTNFLFLENYRVDNLWIKFTSPKKEFRLPSFLQEEQISKLLDYLNKNANSHKKLQFLVMTELLYSTGMRVSELVTLKKAAITDDFKHIYVRGKGNKERVLPLADIVRNLLIKYFESLDKKNNWLFPSRKTHITRQTYFLYLKKVARQVDIDPETISPHSLRHAFASHMLKNGADLKVIQYLLGHEDISTVEIYTHINMKETVKAMKKHPLAFNMTKE